MTTLEIELTELEERLAKLKARARAEAAAPPKKAGSALSAKWDGRDSFSVKETAEILGIGRNSAYDAVNSREIPSIRIGNRLLVPRAALERMLEGAA
jgi:excisionase family DNA binding protein